jgi:hypothetical protein
MRFVNFPSDPTTGSPMPSYGICRIFSIYRCAHTESIDSREAARSPHARGIARRIRRLEASSMSPKKITLLSVLLFCATWVVAQAAPGGGARGTSGTPGQTSPGVPPTGNTGQPLTGNATAPPTGSTPGANTAPGSNPTNPSAPGGSSTTNPNAPNGGSTNPQNSNPGSNPGTSNPGGTNPGSTTPNNPPPTGPNT